MAIKTDANINNGYVKFLRGSSTAYDLVVQNKEIDSNTLYFISDDDSTGVLYLGSKKIGFGGIDELKGLADGVSLEQNEKGIISIANYGKEYFLYDSTENKYNKVIVGEPVNKDEPNGAKYEWITGLTLQVYTEDSAKKLGWFSPNTSTLDGAIDEIESIAADVVELQKEFETFEGQVADQINTAIGRTNLLSYKIIDNETANNETSLAAYLKALGEDVKKYIFLVYNSKNDVYEEYLCFIDYITDENGNIQTDDQDNPIIDESSYKLDKIGDWKVDLSGYATKTDIAGINSDIDAIEADIIEIDSALSGLENYKTETIAPLITKVNELDSSLSALNGIVQGHTTSLEGINNQITTIGQRLDSAEGRLDDIESDIVEHESNISDLTAALTWTDLKTPQTPPETV